MKRIMLCLTLSALFATPLIGQERAATKAPLRQGAPAAGSPSDTATPMTPEIWYYMQEQKRWDDPKQAIRRNAEFRASQRRARIESSRWFGYSRLRPQASPIPIMGTASPAWTGNSYLPYNWVGTGRTSFIYPSAFYR